VASASVVAETDDVVVYVMTRDFVEQALVNNPALTGRFYKFLASLLASRIRTKRTVSESPFVDEAKAPMSDQQFVVRFNLKDKAATILHEWTAALDKGKQLQLYGSLVLSQQVLGFWSGVLGSSTRILVPLHDITHVEAYGQSIIVKLRTDTQHTFCDLDEPEEVTKEIRQQMSAASHSGKKFEGTIDKSTQDLDWSKFLAGAELRRFGLNEVILQEGEEAAFVFQVGHGLASVQIKENGVVKSVRDLRTGEMFGEMAFLMGGAASATIVAGQENTMIYCIKKNFVDSLLYVSTNAELPGRFYKYLATTLAGRLRN